MRGACSPRSTRRGASWGTVDWTDCFAAHNFTFSDCLETEIIGADCWCVGGCRYSPEQMFAVVAAVDLYEDFVPWCQRSRIIRRHENGSFDAELEIGFKFLVESYVSHVEMEKPKYIKVRTSSWYYHHTLLVST